jgi:hypothetical protein
MKRILGMMALVIVLMVPTASFAASDQLGIYVAPKFAFGGLMGHDVDFTWTTSDKAQGGGYDRKTGSSSFDGDWIYGGALAIGYDFYHRFAERKNCRKFPFRSLYTHVPTLQRAASVRHGLRPNPLHVKAVLQGET